MTPQERDLLSRFLDDLVRAQPGPKDAEAAGQIDRTLAANPDAAYVLVQHAIVADAALHDARVQVTELQAQLDAQGRDAPPASEPAPSFLGALFGHARPNEEVAQTARWSPATPAVPASPAPFGYGGAPQQGAGPFSGGGGLGSFLRSAGTTAAGVAGGAFLFEGLSDVFGGGERRHEMFDSGGRSGFAGLGDGDRGGGAFDIDDGSAAGGDFG